MPRVPTPLIPADVAFTADGVPYSLRFDDVYHSSDGGLLQARHVFLSGNALPARWRERESFTIVETGFGLGLNFLACWQALREDPHAARRLHFVSVEKHPFRPEGLRNVHQRWPELAPLSHELIAAWPPLIGGFHRLHLDGGRITLTLLLGNAIDLLPQLLAGADAFFLDGFAPAKNPELWSAPLCKELARLARPGATLATYTVASSVRDALRAAGFATEKRRGFAAKREMLIGRRSGRDEATLPTRDQRAVVIGAGLAGTSCAQHLAARGWQVDIVERQASIAEEASGIPAGVLRPVVHGEDTVQARLSRSAVGYATRHLRVLDRGGAGLVWGGNGLLHLAVKAGDSARFEQMAERYRFPADFARLVDAAEARRLAGNAVGAAGFWFPHGAWVNLPSLCRANLETAGAHASLHIGRLVMQLVEHRDEWRVLDDAGREIASAPVLILANANACARMIPPCSLPLMTVRGQVSLVPASPGRRLDIAIAGDGYIAPAPDGGHCIGATFQRDDEGIDMRVRDHGENLARAEALIPGFTAGLLASSLHGRVALRSTTSDRMPVFGELKSGEIKPGLYAATGLGARGLLWAPLGAELLASLICGEPLPAERELLAAVAPERFLSAGDAQERAWSR